MSSRMTLKVKACGQNNIRNGGLYNNNISPINMLLCQATHLVGCEETTPSLQMKSSQATITASTR